MSNENNKMQVDIENLFKQNANDLTAIKELYRKIEELDNKIKQFNYIDTKIVDKIKKDYENFKSEILNNNIQSKQY